MPEFGNKCTLQHRFFVISCILLLSLYTRHKQDLYFSHCNLFSLSYKPCLLGKINGYKKHLVDSKT